MMIVDGVWDDAGMICLVNRSYITLTHIENKGFYELGLLDFQNVHFAVGFIKSLQTLRLQDGFLNNWML